jgi:hypothetical protein
VPEIADSEMAQLSEAAGGVQRSQRLLCRFHVAAPVHLVHVDAVGAERLQGEVQCFDDRRFAVLFFSGAGVRPAKQCVQRERKLNPAVVSRVSMSPCEREIQITVVKAREAGDRS